ncbi:hypothetical protein D3C79_967990 [compost metagenome]
MCARNSGTCATPRPKARDTAIISRARRSRRVLARILIPEAATAPNMTMAAPPSTGSGTAWITPATLGNRPSSTSITAIQIPIWRLAIPVS